MVNKIVFLNRLYVDKVRNYAKAMPTRDAVNRAVDECIKEGILADFLMKYKAEAIEVSIFEYNEADHMAYVHEEGLEKGRIEERISLTRKMLAKNIDAAQIADIYEEEEVIVKKMISLIENNPQKTNAELAKIFLENGEI